MGRSTMIHTGNCLDILPTLPAQSVHCVVTSPPYWGLRDYGHADQLGNERTPGEYVAHMVQVFREVWRVLRDDGTVWLNLGDSYYGGKGSNGNSKARRTAGERGYKQSGGTVQMATRPLDMPQEGLKPKDLVGIPWRVAFALQDDGWYLRQDIIWHKPNPMPESVQDRCTKAHEYVFLLAKQPRYYYDAEAVKEENSPTSKMGGVYANDSKQTQCGNGHSGIAAEGKINIWAGRNRRSVWTVTTSPYKGAHFATMPPKLVEPCVLAGCPVGGVVLDPFAGSGTTGAVAVGHGRNFIGIELNPDYVALAERRIGTTQMTFQLEGEVDDGA